MTPERWRQVKRILEETFEQDSRARAAYLASVCAGDEGLRRDVESFLDADRSEGFLEEPAVDRAPAVPDTAIESPATVAVGNVDEVRPAELPPYTTLTISTRTSQYELVVVAPLDLEVLVTGGRRFTDTTRAHLHRQESIRIGEELVLIIGTRKVVTSPVQRIEIKS